MKELQFKTNIKCGGCIDKVTPYLNEYVGAENWKVDINDPQKTLTVTNQDNENKVKEALKKAGYKAEKL